MKIQMQVFCPNCVITSSIDYIGSVGGLYQTCPTCGVAMQSLNQIVEDAARRFYEQNKP